MNEELNRIEKFHGHLGPYVVIGYRMGKIANRILGPDPFSKDAVVWTENTPPMSCVVDGIQISSGCTLGKGNIKVEQGDIPKVAFTNKDGKQIKIKLKIEIKNEIDNSVTEENITSYSQEIFQRLDEELFEIS
jgi:formylmethanofuran dehydrogenase subunit E